MLPGHSRSGRPRLGHDHGAGAMIHGNLAMVFWYIVAALEIFWFGMMIPASVRGWRRGADGRVLLAVLWTWMIPTAVFTQQLIYYHVPVSIVTGLLGVAVATTTGATLYWLWLGNPANAKLGGKDEDEQSG